MFQQRTLICFVKFNTSWLICKADRVLSQKLCFYLGKEDWYFLFMKPKETKICEHCGKPMEYRKKWRNNWSEVKFCSERCRRSKSSKIDKP